MVVAHEKYSQIVEQARNSTLIQPTNIEQVSQDEAGKMKTMVEGKSVVVEKIEDAIRANSLLLNEFSKRAESILAPSFEKETTEEVRRFAIEQKTNEIIAEVAKVQIQSASFESYHAHSGAEQEASMPFEEGSIFA